MKIFSQFPSGGDLRSVGSCPAVRTLPFLIVSAALLLPTAALAGPPNEPFGKGDLDKGKFSVELFRGAAVPFELSVAATPNNCQGHMDLQIKWDQADNEVVLDLTSDGALEPFPDVDRTEGVDFFANPFFPEPPDYIDGRYQLWIISAAGPITMFLYDPMTLDLLGSINDFAQPPPAIPVFFPTLYMFSTPMFQADANGDADLHWVFDYDAAVRGDRPEFAHHLVTFPPPNLCGANPDRLDLSTLRPYISPPLPADQARPWSDYLRGGMLFDVTIEPADYFVEPPLTTLMATYSGATAVAGGVPRGWNFDIDAAFMNVAPPIRPWSGAGSCENVFAGVHTTGLDICGGAP